MKKYLKNRYGAFIIYFGTLIVYSLKN